MKFIKSDPGRYVFVFNDAVKMASMPIDDVIEDSVLSKNKNNSGAYEIHSGHSQLEDLGVPVGLITNNESDYLHGGSGIKLVHKIINDEVINDDLFDSLFEKVCKIKTKKYSNNNKTKKIKKNTL